MASNDITGRIAFELTRGAAWVISRFRTIEVVEGDPAVFCSRLADGSGRRLDAWYDGDGCFHMIIWGWTCEVHFRPRQGSPAAAA